MSNDAMSVATATEIAKRATIEMKLEAIVIGVSDVDRSKSFYSRLGWRLDADFVVGNAFRVVQFTPPGSACCVHFGKGLTSAEPGSAKVIYLVVPDIEAARAELVARGVDASEVYHRAGPGQPPIGGRDPEARSYSSFATFADPDGNGGCCRRSRTDCLVARTRRTRHSRVFGACRCVAAGGFGTCRA